MRFINVLTITGYVETKLQHLPASRTSHLPLLPHRPSPHVPNVPPAHAPPRSNEAVIHAAAQPVPGSQPLAFSSRYAVSMWTQFQLLMHRALVVSGSRFACGPRGNIDTRAPSARVPHDADGTSGLAYLHALVSGHSPPPVRHTVLQPLPRLTHRHTNPHQTHIHVNADVLAQPALQRAALPGHPGHGHHVRHPVLGPRQQEVSERGAGAMHLTCAPRQYVQQHIRCY